MEAEEAIKPLEAWFSCILSTFLRRRGHVVADGQAGRLAGWMVGTCNVHRVDISLRPAYIMYTAETEA